MLTLFYESGSKKIWVGIAPKFALSKELSTAFKVAVTLNTEVSWIVLFYFFPFSHL